MSHWLVRHSDIADKVLGETHPKALEWTKALNAIPSISYALQYSDGLCRKEFTDPYATDYALYRGDFKVLAGQHVAVNGQNSSKMLQVAGRGWENYLDERFWPFDPANPLADKYIRFQTDIATILTETLDRVLEEDNSLQLDYGFAPTGILTNFRIDAADTESMYSKYRTLSGQSPGFDFDITPDRLFRIFYPEKNTNPTYRIAEGENLLELFYENNGPDGNWILGLGASGNQRRGSVKQNLQSQALHRRLDATRDFGDVIDQGLIDRLTEGELNRAAVDVVNLRAIVHVEESENVWAEVEPGDTIQVTGWVAGAYDYVDDNLRITTMTGRVNDLGDEQIEFGFDLDEVS